MADHPIKLHIKNGQVVCSPDSLSAPTFDKAQWVAPKDGGFTIEFKTESPFVSQAGKPGTPITSKDGSPTKLETLKLVFPDKKSFKYTVTLSGIVEDPEILIDNSGDHHPKKPKKTNGKKKT
jgi:hypothetical protein